MPPPALLVAHGRPKTPSGLPKKPEKRIFRKSLGTVGFPKHRSSVFTRSGPSRDFGVVECLPEASIDPALLELLARMTTKDLASVDKWFGARGKFPAVHISTGEISA